MGGCLALHNPRPSPPPNATLTKPLRLTDGRATRSQQSRFSITATLGTGYCSACQLSCVCVGGGQRIPPSQNLEMSEFRVAYSRNHPSGAATRKTVFPRLRLSFVNNINVSLPKVDVKDVINEMILMDGASSQWTLGKITGVATLPETPGCCCTSQNATYTHTHTQSFLSYCQRAIQVDFSPSLGSCCLSFLFFSFS